MQFLVQSEISNFDADLFHFQIDFKKSSLSKYLTISTPRVESIAQLFLITFYGPLSNYELLSLY